jgi:tRNA threonylcarbamoyladenosine biosynthesis protein TsaB
MRILAIETATSLGSVALLDGDAVVREVAERVSQRHLEWLAPAISGMLGASGWKPEDVQGVAVSRGPGTFTGLRIGIATAAAWAYARSVPVVGVSTLEALATGTAAAGARGLVCPLLDARREEFAFALFEWAPAFRRVLEDAVGPLDALLERVPEGRPVTFTGDGVPRIAERIRGRAGWRIAPEITWYPRAAFTGVVGMRRLTRGESDEPHLLRPVYARPAGITPSPGA